MYLLFVSHICVCIGVTTLRYRCCCNLGTPYGYFSIIIYHPQHPHPLAHFHSRSFPNFQLSYFLLCFVYLMPLFLLLRSHYVPKICSCIGVGVSLFTWCVFVCEMGACSALCCALMGFCYAYVIDYVMLR